MIYVSDEDRQKTIEHMLEVIRKALEKPGSYFEFGQTIPWNLDKRVSMGVSVVKLAVYTGEPIKGLDREITPEEAAEYVRSNG